MATQLQTKHDFPMSHTYRPLPKGLLQRKCACGKQTAGGEECDECKKKKLALQTKLTIGASNDPMEGEADRMADAVLSGRKSALANRSTFGLQRYSAALAETSETVPDNVGHVLGSSGKPLDEALRSEMEAGFEHDFSGVRVHSDNTAGESAREVNAQAYTVGNHVVFGAGRYSPGTQEGRRLIAHELTHVVQQSGTGFGSVQRQPEGEKKEPTSDLGKALKKNELFQKLPDFAQEKILDEIDKAPETITQTIFDKIIDLSPIDEKYKEGLKKAGEALIKTIAGGQKPSTSICDIPGYHEGTSSTYKGMCCNNSIESEMACCPKDKFAPNNAPFCCKPDEFVNADKKCEKFSGINYGAICLPPGKKDALNKCCMPPFQVIQGICTMPPPKPEAPAQPLALNFRVGVIDDFDIDKSVINSRQQPQYDKVKNKILKILETCPAAFITVTGFADKPGTEEHNMGLGQRRADHVSVLLKIDLIKVKPGGLGPIVMARSEGENNPVDTAVGESYSSRNRRVEIEINAQCPALGSLSLTKPTMKPIGLGMRESSLIGDLK